MIKFATIGTSDITRQFIGVVRQNPEAEITAVYSRTAKKAAEFAEESKSPKFYHKLEQIAEDAEIDAVYIASPNSIHFQQVSEMLRAGKHVLCEKTLGSNKAEESLMFQEAKDNGVILLEAIRTLHDPAFQTIKENLHKLGCIRKATLEFCQYSSRYDAFKDGRDVNIFKKELSAGALMDIGVYCVQALIDLFGKPDRIMAESVFLDNGADGAGTILVKYESMVAEVSYSKITDSNNFSQIQGEDGVLYIEKIQNPQKAFIVYHNGTKEILSLPECKNNMIYELEYFIECIKEKKTPSYFNQVSVDVIALMDEARAQMGLVFPADR